ncbi:MAG: MFS transporter [Cupriavidus sp.]|nr:MAG: MFS transporter [Cupriavidus sp.]
MSNRRYRWVIVIAGGILGCVAMGSVFCLPVLLQAITLETGWSMTGVSTAMTVVFISMAFSSMVWGALSDRFGPMPVVLLGSIGIAATLALASQARSLLMFQFLFGGLLGMFSAAILPPVMATVTGWFDTHRSLAVSLVSAGMGVAPMTMSPLVAWLVSHHDWRTTMLTVAAIAAAIMIPGALFLRRPPQAPAAADDIAAAPSAAPANLRAQLLRSPQFLILVATNFLCCATHSGPIIHTVSYAIACGIPLVAAVSIYSIEGLSGLFGRVVFGVLGDRFGARKVLVTGLLIQAVGALGYLFAQKISGFYFAAALFGFVYAGTMPLYAVIARENFPLDMMGTVIGALAMAGSFGMATGPVIGGMIYDAFSSYAWLYIGSCLVGFAAFAVALCFRPAGVAPGPAATSPAQ